MFIFIAFIDKLERLTSVDQCIEVIHHQVLLLCDGFDDWLVSL